MVKQLYNLTLNEIIKKYKKKSLIVITVIIFLVGILYPVLMKKTVNNLGNINSIQYSFAQGELQGKVSKIDMKSQGAKVSKAFLESQIQEQKLLEDVKANPTGWKVLEAQNYLDSLLKVDALNALKDGTTPKIIMDSLPQEINPASIEKVLMTPKAEIDKEVSKNQKEANTTRDMIKNNDYLSYLKKDIKVKEDSIKDLNKNLDVLQKEMKKDKSNNLLNSQIEKLKMTIKDANSQLNIEKYRYNNKIAFNEKEWKSAALTVISQNTAIVNKKIMSKEEYLKASNGSKITYETYTKVFNKNKEKAENNINVAWYSLKHNIPQTGEACASSHVLQSGNEIFVIIIAILGAVLAGGIVSNEFSRGTIRLLLIRPNKRWKVLISKLISVILISYVILFVSMIVAGITSGVIFGFKAYGYPILKVVNGQVVEINYFLDLIKGLLFNSITILFIISIAFMISTVAKSTAVSVAISILLFIGSFPATLILLGQNYFWALKTPIPYIDLPVVKGIEALNPQVLFSRNLGAIELLIVSIILIIISLLVFCKKDVVN